jgi:type IV secretory pathway VirB9-like protein
VVAAPSPALERVAADPPRPRHQPSDGKRVALVEADDTDDGYVVNGTADWKPVTVYSKGGKTYIEMPASVRHKEAPVLFEQTRKGLFHHETILVNYRVKGRWYVVDKVIDKGTLVSGVGLAVALGLPSIFPGLLHRSGPLAFVDLSAPKQENR